MTHKLIYLARRNPQIAPEDFGAVWRSHSQLASTLGSTFSSNFTRVRQCIKAYEVDAPAAYRNDYDGVAILTMKSWEALKAARSHPKAVTTMRDDELRVFAEYAANFTMAVEETFNSGLDGQAALILFVKRRSDVPLEAFDAAWRAWGEALAGSAETHGARACKLNRVIEAPGPRFDFTGIAELWFDDLEAATAAARQAHEGFLQGIADAINAGDTVSMLVRINFEKIPSG